MKKNTKYIIYAVFIAFTFPSISLAQKGKTDAHIANAEKHYQALKYAYAIPLLEKALTAQPQHTKSIELLANSYRKTKQYQSAAKWYSKLVELSPPKLEWALSYAEVLANLGQYEASEIWYKKYLGLANNDSRASAFAESYPSIDSFMKNKTRWKIGFTNLNTSLAEYAPMYYKDGLLFVSNRKTEVLTKNVFGWDQTPFSDLYYIDHLNKIKPINVDSVMLAAKNDKNTSRFYRANNDDTYRTSNDSRTFIDHSLVINDTLSKALGNLGLATKLSGFVNTKYHEGPAALLPDGSLMFTRNNYFKGKARKSTQGITKLKMFTAAAPGFDDLKPFIHNSDEYSTGHPALNQQGTLLIFASDMPGGFGGTDLYFCTRTSIKDEWSKPINMGKRVNTEGDELFPTLHQNNILFFSSTGHVGLGGLDIFQIQLEGNLPTGSPINLGAPINSSVDDFSLIRDESGLNGFFTSNRKGNDDIYAFGYQDYKIILKGILTEKATGQGIANINIVVNNLNQQFTIKTDNKGNFIYELPKDASTRLDFNIPHFKTANLEIGTQDIHSDTVLTRDIALEKMMETAISKIPVQECDAIRKLISQFIIYYDLDKSFIRKDAALVADQVAIFLKQHPEFDLVASSYCDSRASNAYNMALSLRRSQSAKQYLVARGIDASKIKIRHFGEQNLVNSCKDGVNCSEAQQQLNRRTQFYIIYKGQNIQDIDCGTLTSAIK
ncbi:OmpA family protein [Pedobacter xixiisoli]|uniref:Anaphase-promoting complex, cyclosome, subunit 3 n=1 Tax=Pedobacter xixiisoli TaxID=1476464 RepID=A0A285ZVU0_9SPHI|nr:OmpA family protein [Pedobacter xixiisoli]SOD13758.1 Anaphase-promoting complex, cyclosome, subunit 3 [Pedobacter xixiisoli]